MQRVNKTITKRKITIDPLSVFGSPNKPEVDYYTERLACQMLREGKNKIVAGTYNVKCILWHEGEKDQSEGVKIEIEVKSDIGLLDPLRGDKESLAKLGLFLQNQLINRNLTVKALDTAQAAQSIKERVIKSELYLLNLSSNETLTFFLVYPIVFRTRIGRQSDKRGLRLEIIGKKLGNGARRQFNECVSISLHQQDPALPPIVKLFPSERGFLIGDNEDYSENERKKLIYLYDTYTPKKLIKAKITKTSTSHQFILPMKRIQEKTLIDFLQQDLSMLKRIRLSLALIDGQEELESLGLIHGDIQPRNIMVRLINSVFFKTQLIDFEYMLFKDEFNERRVYTLDYAAAEILEHLPATFSSDFASTMLCVAAVFGRNGCFKTQEKIAIFRYALHDPVSISEKNKLNGMFSKLPEIPASEKDLIKTLIIETTIPDLKLRKDRKYAREILHYLENKYVLGCAQLLSNQEWLASTGDQFPQETVQTYQSIANAIMTTYHSDKNFVTNLKKNIAKLISHDKNVNFHQSIHARLAQFENDIRLFSAPFHAPIDGKIHAEDIQVRNNLFKNGIEVEKIVCVIQACTGLANYILNGNDHLGFFNKRIDPHSGEKRAQIYLEKIMQAEKLDDILLVIYTILAYWGGGRQLKCDIAGKMGISVREAEEKLRQILTNGKTQEERDTLNEIVRQHISDATGKNIPR